MFPIIPALAALALGGGAYLVLHKDKDSGQPAPKPSTTPAVLPPPPPKTQGTPQPAIPQIPIPAIPPIVAPPGPNPLPPPPAPTQTTASPIPIPGVALPPNIAPSAIPIPAVLTTTQQPAPVILPSPVEPVPGLTATVLGDPGTNLRGSPSTTAPILAGVVKGTKVKIVDPIPTPPTTGAPLGWFKVLAPTGQTGFMSAQFLQLDGAAAPAPGVPPAPGPSPLPIPVVQFGNATVLGNPGLNLRSQPSTSGQILKGLFAGTRVKITGNKLPATTGAPQGWFPVQTPDGMSGFASAEFLRVDAGAGFAGEGLPRRRRNYAIQG